jgi:class 3 adenylate cyclase
MGFASVLAGQLRQGGVFLTGGAGELAALFGSPEPLLPPGDPDPTGRERIGVETSPRIRESFGRWLGAAARNLEHAAVSMPAAGSAVETSEREYRETLQETLRSARAADRRQGVVNLFWLAHSREVSEEIERQFCGGGLSAETRYRLHPLLSGIMRRADEGSRTSAGRPQQQLLDFRRGAACSDALVDAVIDDQLALTEPDPRSFDPLRVLVPANPRFRIGATAFVEICEILRSRLAVAVADRERGLLAALERAGVADRERGLLAALERVGVAAPPDASAPAQDWQRLIFADPVREHLLHDLDGTAAQLARSRALRREISPERTWGDLLEDFAEVARCVRRAEAIHLLRRALDFSAHGIEHRATRERYLEGRLFRFGSPQPVQSGVRTASILFADLREFTRASEGPVSEGGLARELYEIFDPAALIVRRFGGAVDAYLGDGFMATFGGGAHPGEECLAAVRAAVALQQVLDRLRRLGRTSFRMGISLHTGRVAVARFLRDETNAMTTVIGRQVNIAGRLSASEGDAAGIREGAGAHVVGEVAVDREGHLVNHGIVVSGPMLDTLQGLIGGEAFNEGGIEGVRWYDPDLCLWLHFGYVGVARFRGVEAAIPVFSLGHAPPALRSRP